MQYIQIFVRLLLSLSKLLLRNDSGAIDVYSQSADNTSDNSFILSASNTMNLDEQQGSWSSSGSGSNSNSRNYLQGDYNGQYGKDNSNDTNFNASEIDAKLFLGHHNEINQSVELQCMMQEYIEAANYGNTTEYCLTHFDSILCWPRTPRGTLAVLQCMAELKGIHYDNTQNATRYCHSNGTWERYTNYDSCIHLPAPAIISEFNVIVELPTIIYYIGYAISLVSLTLALVVLAYFKELRCLRNTIHANLFFTYIMSAFFWILLLSVQISISSGLASCIILVTLFHFFTLTNFFWMLVEGLYLYMLVVKTFAGDNIRFNIYATIGWGGPAVFVILWTIAKSLTVSQNNEEFEIQCPWMSETNVDWIFQGPVFVVLLINLIFLLRIMWVLITKLRSANTVETRQYHKAAKALLVLIPLFGITYLVVLAGPSENGFMGHMFAVMRAVLLSTQGFSVSLFYCFLNFEVRNTLRHHISTWREERNIQLNQMRRNTYSKNSSQRAECVRPLTSYYGKDKRESCVSSATTTTLVSHPAPLTLHRASNSALHMLPTTIGSTSASTISIFPHAISPLMKQGLEENSV